MLGFNWLHLLLQHLVLLLLLLLFLLFLAL